MNVGARVRGFLAERDLLTTFLTVAAVVGVGVLAGMQYMMPDKRVLAATAAIVIAGIAWRLDIVSAIGLLLFALPFPRYTSFGSTSLAFVLLLTVVWLLRYTQREAAPPRRTPLDVPILLLLGAYVLSFYNVVSLQDAAGALTVTIALLSTLILYYLITSNVRTEADLRRMHFFQTIAIGLIFAFCIWELLFPSHTLIPGWIDLRSTQIEDMALARTFRLGGPWFDYELLSEFVAMNLIFFIFMIAQARSMTRRVVYSIFALVSVAIQFATVTRGGMIALVIGLGYLLFLIRRRLNIVPLTILAIVSVFAVTGISLLVREKTSAGDIFSRFEETKLINGMPDSRAAVWPQVWERWMQHPLIGNGPYYAPRRQLTLWYWPHSLPLYLGHTIGFFGLGAFVWIIVRLWKRTRPPTDRLNDPSYAGAFLIVARVQLVIFMIDEMKIEYLRNPNYQYQVWIMFAVAIAASQIAAAQVAARSESTAPDPARAPGYRLAHPARP